MLPISGPALADGAVAVRDGRILAVGSRDEVAGAHPGLPEHDLGDVVLMPGLVDVHLHLEWSLARGLLPPAPFDRWLGGMLALRARYRPETAEAAAHLGALLALEAGTTTLADAGPAGAGVAALASAGLRGQVCLEAFGRPEGGEATAAAAAVGERLAALDEGAGDRVRVGISPHAPYSVGPELWRALLRDGAMVGRPVSCHLAESPAELAAIGAGKGPLAAALAAAGLAPARWPGSRIAGVVARLDAEGALRPGLLAAHCVAIDPGEADALATARVAVAHCPTSNARLRCGRAPLERLARAGVVVGLGTDGPASAGPYDLRAEARACELVHLAAGLDGPSPAELVRLMTLGGAEALGRGDELGHLAPGAHADLVALRPPPASSGAAPEELALDPGSRVVTVVVGGEPLLHAGRHLRVDAEAIRARAGERRAALVGSG